MCSVGFPPHQIVVVMQVKTKNHLPGVRVTISLNICHCFSFFFFLHFLNFIFIREEIREVLFSIQCCFKLANEAENVAKCKVEEIRKIF